MKAGFFSGAMVFAILVWTAQSFAQQPAPGSISGIVWKDLNDNGLRENEEPGVKGVIVTIGSINLGNVAKDTTDENGRYSFQSLRPQLYDIILDKKSLPSSLKVSSKFKTRDGGGSDATDSDFSSTLYRTSALVRSESPTPSEAHQADAALVTKPIQTQKYDISLGFSPNRQIIMRGDTFSYTMLVKNEGEGIANEVELTDFSVEPYNPGFKIIRTDYDPGSQKTEFPSRINYQGDEVRWAFDSIQPGNTMALTNFVKARTSGLYYSRAEITFMAEKDDDSTPNNNVASEDDMVLTCFSVPYLFKQGENGKATFKLPPQFSGVVWQRKAPDGTLSQAGTGNTLEVSENDPGTYEYTFTFTDGTCPADGCCPGYVIVQEVRPKSLCVPVTVTIVKK